MNMVGTTCRFLLQVVAVGAIIHYPLNLLSLQQLQDHRDIICVDKQLGKIFKLQDI